MTKKPTQLELLGVTDPNKQPTRPYTWKITPEEREKLLVDRVESMKRGRETAKADRNRRLAQLK